MAQDSKETNRSAGEDRFDFEDSTVSLELDGGVTLECEIVCVFKADGKEYIALLPLEDEGAEDSGEVFLYGFSLVNNEPALRYIDSDEEYEIASDAFDEWLDQHEFDEIVEADE